jgi:hypothetical protein
MAATICSMTRAVFFSFLSSAAKSQPRCGVFFSTWQCSQRTPRAKSKPAHVGLQLRLGNILWEHLQIRELVRKLCGWLGAGEQERDRGDPNTQRAIDLRTCCDAGLYFDFCGFIFQVPECWSAGAAARFDANASISTVIAQSTTVLILILSSAGGYFLCERDSRSGEKVRQVFLPSRYTS